MAVERVHHDAPRRAADAGLLCFSNDVRAEPGRASALGTGAPCCATGNEECRMQNPDAAIQSRRLMSEFAF